MSEIEKLYKNAEIEKHITCNHVNCPQYGAFGRDKCAVKTRIPTEECIKNKEYTTAEYVYPPFTAKKQLELIKWLVINKLISIKSKYKNNLFIVYVECRCYPRNYRPLDEAIADFINMNWQDLTDTEQAEIKEILK